jgi:SAM-dependent methyltransferase
MSIRTSWEYPKILEKVKSGEKLLDLGCCFGQDLRSLAADGAPTENLYGSDLEQRFLDLGYEMFRDKEKFKGTFYAADVFDANSQLRKDLKGKMGVIHCGSFLHLFNWSQQVEVVEAICDMLKDTPGTMVAGRQTGSMESGEYRTRLSDRTRFRHNKESFEKLWKEVGEKKGHQFKVETRWGGWGEVHGKPGEKQQMRHNWDNPDKSRWVIIIAFCFHFVCSSVAAVPGLM